MWLRLISASMAAWNLMPAISAPENSRRTWMSWMVLPVTVLKTAPRLPTMPACSQCEMVLLRTMWWPMVSLVQPFVRARSIVLT